MSGKRSGVVIGIISGVALLGVVAGMLGNSKMIKKRRIVKGAKNALNNVSGAIERITTV